MWLEMNFRSTHSKQPQLSSRLVTAHSPKIAEAPRAVGLLEKGVSVGTERLFQARIFLVHLSLLFMVVVLLSGFGIDLISLLP